MLPQVFPCNHAIEDSNRIPKLHDCLIKQGDIYYPYFPTMRFDRRRSLFRASCIRLYRDNSTTEIGADIGSPRCSFLGNAYAILASEPRLRDVKTGTFTSHLPPTNQRQFFIQARPRTSFLGSAAVARGRFPSPMLALLGTVPRFLHSCKHLPGRGI